MPKFRPPKPSEPTDLRSCKWCGDRLAPVYKDGNCFDDIIGFGFGSDGYFCSKHCGYLFGMALADLGEVYSTSRTRRAVLRKTVDLNGNPRLSMTVFFYAAGDFAVYGGGSRLLAEGQKRRLDGQIVFHSRSSILMQCDVDAIKAIVAGGQ